LGVDFDASDDPPASKVALMSYKGAESVSVWDSCEVQCAPADLVKMAKERYVRLGSTTDDIKTFDVGNLHVATQGCADASVIGELYVSYDVEFRTPQTDEDGKMSAYSAYYSITGESRAIPFGTSSTLLAGSLVLDMLDATVTFPAPGGYLLYFTIAGTNITNVLPTITGTATVTTCPGGVLYYNAALTAAAFLIGVKVSEGNQTAIFDFTASCDTLTAMSVRAVRTLTTGMI
jgi:hypothetical protein